MKNKLPVILLGLTAIPLSVLMSLAMEYAGFEIAASLAPTMQAGIQIVISAILSEI
jgi:hypothetical protein